ncbi:MAG TPA: hypothetical protein VFT31_13805 [Kribbella sp.]|nr:hypothetical protein [Kribbella sp.]
MQPLIEPAERTTSLVAAGVILRLLTAAGLVVDAVVHLRVAGDYDRVGTQFTEGTMFRLESGVALLAALLVMLIPRWQTILFAVLVAGSAVLALLASVYWQPGPVGPFPDMYEPIWFTDKVIAVLAESVSLVAGLAALLIHTLSARTEP